MRRWEVWKEKREENLAIRKGRRQKLENIKLKVLERSRERGKAEKQRAGKDMAFNW